MNNLPQDPFMLLSVVNTLLRDEYDSLDELCGAMDVDINSIIDKLAASGFEYMPEINQFR